MGVGSLKLGVGGKTGLRRFEDLDIWKEAQMLAVEIYKLTRNFPDDERFNLTSQLKRSSSSISANIAEGFGRSSIKDKLHFYTIAYGSLLETKNFLYLSHKLDFIEDKSLNSLLNDVVLCQKLLSGLMSSTRRKL